MCWLWRLQKGPGCQTPPLPPFAACVPGWAGAHCVLCDPANATACAAVYAGSTCTVESPEEAFNSTTVLKGYDDCSVVESSLDGMTLDQASLYGRCGTNFTGLEGSWACSLFFTAAMPAAELNVELAGCTTPTNPPADGELVVDCATVSPSCTSGCDPTPPPGDPGGLTSRGRARACALRPPPRVPLAGSSAALVWQLWPPLCRTVRNSPSRSRGDAPPCNNAPC